MEEMVQQWEVGWEVGDWGEHPHSFPLVGWLELSGSTGEGCELQRGYSDPGVESRQSTPHE